MKKSVQTKETLSKSKTPPVTPQRTVVMNSSPKKAEDKSDSKKDENSGGQSVKLSLPNRQETEQITVQITDIANGRNVEIKDATNKSDKKADTSDLVKKNKLYGEDQLKVVSGRKALSASLFKLSAHMSQLQKETVGVESGLRYAEELRRQLRETEDLVRLREEKVDKLREGIKIQHQQIVAERSKLQVLEGACRAGGVTVPEEGAENIQRKLAQIKQTAMKVKDKTRDEDQEEAVKKAATAAETAPNKSQEAEMKMDPVDKASTGKKAALTKKPASPESGPGPAAGEQVGSAGGDHASPLAHLHRPAGTGTLDPNRRLCRFQLAGKCLDTTCPDQHTD
jgi:hypothetical protein